MAVNTWDGAVDTDWNREVNWNTTGETDRVPTGADDVVIANVTNDPVIPSSTDPTINSLAIESGGNLDGNGNEITIDGENGAGLAVDLDGIITGTDTDITITTAAATDLDLECTGSIRNLTINHASCAAVLIAPVSITGDLTITAGSLNTHSGDNRALTVAGATSVTGTLTCNASAVSLGTGVTSDYGLSVNTNGTFVGGSGTHTMGSISVANSAAAVCTLTSGVTTINGEHSSNNRNLNVKGTDGVLNHGSGTVTITYAGTSAIQELSGTLALNNLIINHASANISLKSILTLAGTLTVTAGTFTTDSNNYALTVTGDVSVTGTLTGNASAISMGSLTLAGAGTYNATSGVTTITSETINYAIDLDGTFIHNGGTLTVITPISTYLDLVPSNSAGINNLIINHSSCYANLVGGAPTGSNAIEGDLTVTAGTFNCNNAAVEVDGDVSVTGIIEAHADGDQAVTFGSLTIASGGTYNATSGTTTITDDDKGPEGRCLHVHTDGNFNHNNGLMKFTNASIPEIAVQGGSLTNNPFYDIEVSGGKVYWANNPYILNNCKVKGVQFAGSTSFMHVVGICENSANDYNESNTSTSANHYFGTFVLSGGTIELTAMEITVGSFRNTGGTVS